MNDTTEDNPIEQAMKILIKHGFGGLDQAMTTLINEAIKIERSHALRATAYVPKAEMRERVATDIRNIFNAPNREIKRRTRVSGLFPNEASLRRRVSAI